MKVSELTGPALDWAVAKCEGLLCFGYRSDGERFAVENNDGGIEGFMPSTSWQEGGPIIEREQIDLRSSVNEKGEPVWIAEWWAPAMTPQELRTKRLRSNQYASDTKPLIAAMRCYVASKLGQDVNIPEELL